MCKYLVTLNKGPVYTERKQTRKLNRSKNKRKGSFGLGDNFFVVRMDYLVTNVTVQISRKFVSFIPSVKIPKERTENYSNVKDFFFDFAFTSARCEWVLKFRKWCTYTLKMEIDSRSQTTVFALNATHKYQKILQLKKFGWTR